MSDHVISSGRITARIAAEGAELQSLRDAAGREFLWQAGPQWPRHAPNLFPIVGRLAGDTLRHNGQSYRLTQHGFARDRAFAWVERTDTVCRLALTDDAETRARYPFPFRFEIRYAAVADALAISFTVTNTGAELLPASMGAHPAFVWPLPGCADKAGHTLEFAEDDPAPIRRLSGGLLRPEALPSPIRGRTLALEDALFADDAIILDRPASCSVHYSAPGVPGLVLSWQGFTELGLWMKPGADYICIEPWCGTASPLGFDGAFADKPGLLLIPPGEQRTASLAVRLLG
jgi:galactose mutarotase-like enzyme